jgi:hypothetical protein
MVERLSCEGVLMEIYLTEWLMHNYISLWMSIIIVVATVISSLS